MPNRNEKKDAKIVTASDVVAFNNSGPMPSRSHSKRANIGVCVCVLFANPKNCRVPFGFPFLPHNSTLNKKWTHPIGPLYHEMGVRGALQACPKSVSPWKSSSLRLRQHGTYSNGQMNSYEQPGKPPMNRYGMSSNSRPLYFMLRLLPLGQDFHLPSARSVAWSQSGVGSTLTRCCSARQCPEMPAK